MIVVVPLFLGVMHVALVLHVRNTLTAAASEGARYAAGYDRGFHDGAVRTRRQIATSLADRYASNVRVHGEAVGGQPGVEVTVTANVPALGLWGPTTTVSVDGHAMKETR